MKKLFFCFILFLSCNLVLAENLTDLIEKIDKNTQGVSNIVEAKMIVYGNRSNRAMDYKSYTYSNPKKSFIEFLSPAREKGTKMLKLNKDMWIYTPSSDRTMMISGHMLRQSVMGSDLSYEDLSENRTLAQTYNVKEIGEDNIDGRKIRVFELTAKVPDVSYYKQVMYADTERLIILKLEQYSKSNKLLKELKFSNIKKVGNRWIAFKLILKDTLKSGKGTEVIIKNIEFDKKIPDSIFSKANLKQ